MNDQFRYELKFVLSDRQLIQAQGWLASDTRVSAQYHPRTVNTLYYDTADFCSLKDNLYGIADRVKHRLRWYNDEHSDRVNGICMEVKRRSGRLNTKHRIALSKLAPTLLCEGHYQLRERLMHEIDGTRGFENLAMYLPTLQIQYSREYFEDRNGLRVTLDREILFFQTPLNESLFFGHGILYPWCVMEIKFPRHLKVGASETIRRLRISPKRHSKYAAGLAAFGQTTYF